MMIDVLIPCYNSELYLRRCLNSVFEQSDDNYNVIVVDDFSTDNSFSILNEYKKQYGCRINVHLNSKNMGLSFVRNKLIELSKSDYFIFLDSDDAINCNLIYNLRRVINDTNSDLIRYQSIVHKKGRNSQNKYYCPGFKNLPGPSALEKFLLNDKLFALSWMYCYKKDIFLNNKITFPEGRLQEDLAITSWIIFCSMNVTSIDYIGYNYYRNPNSIMENKEYSFQVRKAYDVLNHFDFLLSKFHSVNISDLMKDLIYRNLSLAVMSKLKFLKGKNYNDYYNEIVKRKIDYFSKLSIEDIIGRKNNSINHFNIEFFSKN